MAWDPSQHPRIPAGQPDGGRFAFAGEENYKVTPKDFAAHDLSNAQTQVVHEYMNEDYAHINPVLRSENHDLLIGRNAAVMDTLDHLISNSKAPGDFVAWRGVTPDMAAMIEQQKPGDTVHDAGYTSLTSDRNMTALLSPSSGSVMKVLVPRDTAIFAPGAYSSRLGESEMLLHRDNVMEYLGKRDAVPPSTRLAKQPEGENPTQYVFRVVSQDRSTGEQNIGRGPQQTDPTASGAWTSNVGHNDLDLLTSDAISVRHSTFAAKYGDAVADKVHQLASDWYTMHPTSHIDSFLKGTLADNSEKTAWEAIRRDTQTGLTAIKGESLDLYRGIPGKIAADAVRQAKVDGASFVEIPLHDSLNLTHQALSATGQEGLAEDYAARRWTRHGGDPVEAHTGIVLHMKVPKSDVIFATAYSAFTNPYTPNWNEYLVSTHGAPSIRLRISDIKVVAG